MSKLLILGLGNDLYGDDGVEIKIISHLKDDKKAQKLFSSHSSEITLKACSLTGLSILDEIVDFDDVIIIDTIKRCDPVTGVIHMLDASDLRHIPGPSPHYVSIPQSIEIGRSIGLQVPTRIKVIAVEAKNMYNLGEGLSSDMQKAIPEIIQKLFELIKTL